ncbi:MAG: hypothetical protein ACYS8S_08115 [Planctomycetota bacterium]
MPRFEYIAINSAKKTEKGTVTAESAFSARKHLRGRGLHPTDIKQVRMETAQTGVKDLFVKSGKKEIDAGVQSAASGGGDRGAGPGGNGGVICRFDRRIRPVF